MKHHFFIFLFFMAALLGCSHVNDTRRVPASMGVIGAKGEVLLYYKEGDYIIVKACEPNTILGMNTEQAKDNCQGKSNKVPVKYFKASLRHLLPFQDSFSEWLGHFKPLTREEVKAYMNGGPAPEQVKVMVAELDKINSFIQVYGEENANLVRKEELVKGLRSQKVLASAISKIDAEIEKAINLIVDDAKLTLTKFHSDKDQFLHNVLRWYDPKQRFPCGLKGSLDERIEDCSYQETSHVEGFVLVTRAEDFKEVHKELKTSLLWSSTLPKRLQNDSAKRACKSIVEFAGLTELKWGLPSINEYREAQKNGIRIALPSKNGWYWSSSLYRKETGMRPSKWWAFSGQDSKYDYSSGQYQDTYHFDTHEDFLVRCVAKQR